MTVIKRMKLFVAVFLLSGVALLGLGNQADAAQTSPRTLKLTSPYMKGDDVEWAQYLLGISEDGIYGPYTASKVKEFQASKGLKADGIVGDNTWNALLKHNGFRTLKLTSPYMTGNDVKSVQATLHLTVDGIYGPNTAAAVKNVQSSNGWPADGIVGPDTWYLMFLLWKYD
jgi:N-acetylmuramoyl-L-alanine amidase